MNDLVLTLIGPDRPGLVEAVADTIAAGGGNWLESRMAHLAGQFAGILRVEVEPGRAETLVESLRKLESRGLRIVLETTRDAQPKHGALVDVELVGQDRPGIVKEISALLASRGVNVEDLRTDRASAPMSGELLFSARARLVLPERLAVSELRAALEELAHDLMVEMRVVEA